MPTVEMSRSCDCDRENDKGRDPARKELIPKSISLLQYSIEPRIVGGCSREGHKGAQREQNEKTVKHPEYMLALSASHSSMFEANSRGFKRKPLRALRSKRRLVAQPFPLSFVLGTDRPSESERE